MDWNAFFYDPQDQPTYFVVEVKDKRITVTAVKQDGSVIDAFSVGRKNRSLHIPPAGNKKEAA